MLFFSIYKLLLFLYTRGWEWTLTVDSNSYMSEFFEENLAASSIATVSFVSIFADQAKPNIFAEK